MTVEGWENPNIEVVELQRTRWRRAREGRGMTVGLEDAFARRGLAARMKNTSARFLVIPSDPDSFKIDFTDGFWQWWQTPPKDPFGESSTSFGSHHGPASDAAVMYEPDYKAGDDSRVWEEYVGLTRTGELEFGLSRTASASSGDQRFFFLLNIVGRVWVAVSRYAEVVSKYRLTGPFETSIAIVGTAGSGLSNLATGWKDPMKGTWHNGFPVCLDEHLLFLRELSRWPDEEGCKVLALEFAERIVNAWGVTDRTFLARSGKWQGEFDVSQYH